MMALWKLAMLAAAGFLAYKVGEYVTGVMQEVGKGLSP